MWMGNPRITKLILPYRAKLDVCHTHIGYPEPASSAKSEEVFSTLRNLLLLVAIYLYFIGWIYVYYYYNHFGISLFSLNIPVYYFFAYSNSVVGNWTTTLILLLLVSLGFKLKHLFLHTYIIGPVVVLLFPVFFVVAKESGISRAQQLRIAGAKPISFILKEGIKKYYPNDFIQANNNGDVRLIYQTKDRYFVFVQPISNENVMPRGNTYDIRMEHILLATIKLENVERGDSAWLKVLGL